VQLLSHDLIRYGMRYENNQFCSGMQLGLRDLTIVFCCGTFVLDVPRASVRGAARSPRETRGTIGVHSKGGSWLVNGSYDGLVAITIDPPIRTDRRASSLFLRMEVNELVVSLVDPDGFIAAVSHWLTRR
jgi:hypothetical protein